MKEKTHQRVLNKNNIYHCRQQHFTSRSYREREREKKEIEKKRKSRIRRFGLVFNLLIIRHLTDDVLSMILISSNVVSSEKSTSDTEIYQSQGTKQVIAPKIIENIESIFIDISFFICF